MTHGPHLNPGPVDPLWECDFCGFGVARAKAFPDASSGTDEIMDGSMQGIYVNLATKNHTASAGRSQRGDIWTGHLFPMAGSAWRFKCTRRCWEVVFLMGGMRFIWEMFPHAPCARTTECQFHSFARMVSNSESRVVQKVLTILKVCAELSSRTIQQDDARSCVPDVWRNESMVQVLHMLSHKHVCTMNLHHECQNPVTKRAPRVHKNNSIVSKQSQNDL